MALYLIVSAILTAFDSKFMAVFLLYAVQLLNFAVLLSYPINFFIYCRMSRSFRDAFTRLLCPKYNQSRQGRLPASGAPLTTKPANLPTSNKNQIEMKKANNVTANLTPTPVIENTKSTELSPNVMFSDNLNGNEQN